MLASAGKSSSFMADWLPHFRVHPRLPQLLPAGGDECHRPHNSSATSTTCAARPGRPSLRHGHKDRCAQTGGVIVIKVYNRKALPGLNTTDQAVEHAPAHNDFKPAVQDMPPDRYQVSRTASTGPPFPSGTANAGTNGSSGARRTNRSRQTRFNEPLNTFLTIVVRASVARFESSRAFWIKSSARIFAAIS